MHAAMLDMQRGLSRLQAIPLVGPVVISPIKATFSVVQIITGLAMTIFLGAATLLNPERDFLDMAFEGMLMTGSGFVSMTYSIVNMISLGVIGFVAEVLIVQSNHRFPAYF